MICCVSVGSGRGTRTPDPRIMISDGPAPYTGRNGSKPPFSDSAQGALDENEVATPRHKSRHTPLYIYGLPFGVAA